MPIPSSGQISSNSIQNEFGGSNPISINEYYRGGSYVPSTASGNLGTIPSSGQISWDHFRGSTKCPAAGALQYYSCSGNDLYGNYTDGNCGIYQQFLASNHPYCAPPPPPPPACDGYGTFYGQACQGPHLYNYYADGSCGSFAEIAEYWSWQCAPAPPPPPEPPPSGGGPSSISYSASRSGFTSQTVTMQASISPAGPSVFVSWNAYSPDGGASVSGGFGIPSGSSSGSQTIGPFGWGSDNPILYSYVVDFSASGSVSPDTGQAYFTIWA